MGENDNSWFTNFSTNRQLAEVAGEIDMIMRHEKKYNIRKKLTDEGKEKYGALGTWTYTIKMLFDLIREDEKNSSICEWLNKQEEQLISFLYSESNAPSEVEVQAFVDECIQKYVDEIEYK